MSTIPFERDRVSQGRYGNIECARVERVDVMSTRCNVDVGASTRVLTGAVRHEVRDARRHARHALHERARPTYNHHTHTYVYLYLTLG